MHITVRNADNPRTAKIFTKTEKKIGSHLLQHNISLIRFDVMVTLKHLIRNL